MPSTFSSHVQDYQGTIKIVNDLVFAKDAQGKSAAGKSVIPAGATFVIVENIHMLASSQVSVTLTAPPSGGGTPPPAPPVTDASSTPPAPPTDTGTTTPP